MTSICTKCRIEIKNCPICGTPVMDIITQPAPTIQQQSKSLQELRKEIVSSSQNRNGVIIDNPQPELQEDKVIVPVPFTRNAPSPTTEKYLQYDPPEAKLVKISDMANQGGVQIANVNYEDFVPIPYVEEPLQPQMQPKPISQPTLQVPPSQPQVQPIPKPKPKPKVKEMQQPVQQEPKILCPYCRRAYVKLLDGGNFVCEACVPHRFGNLATAGIEH